MIITIIIIIIITVISTIIIIIPSDLFKTLAFCLVCLDNISKAVIASKQTNRIRVY